MLTAADQNRLEEMKILYLDWVDGGGDRNDASIEDVANLLVDSDDPQALWDAHVKWSEKLTGAKCPESCRDITQTKRIKNRSIN